jgi:hypothetical protein
LIARDHMDLGCSVCGLGELGLANVFHTHNALAPVPAPDDLDTPQIGWPNFHSGANGDAQRVRAELPIHPVMLHPESESGAIDYLPAHPHEGAVIAPPTASLARVIATGTSLVSGARFNIAVAFEASATSGRALVQSTFHHFSDYNWDPGLGSPDFVTEPHVFTLVNSPGAMASVHRYMRNAALWLAARDC